MSPEAERARAEAGAEAIRLCSLSLSSWEDVSTGSETGRAVVAALRVLLQRLIDAFPTGVDLEIVRLVDEAVASATDEDEAEDELDREYGAALRERTWRAGARAGREQAIAHARDLAAHYRCQPDGTASWAHGVEELADSLAALPLPEDPPCS